MRKACGDSRRSNKAKSGIAGFHRTVGRKEEIRRGGRERRRKGEEKEG